MLRRDPIADARAAASRGDWKVYMEFVDYAKVGEDGGGRNDYAPLSFIVRGLNDVFGCGIDEATFRANAKRSWASYYDVQQVANDWNTKDPSGRECAHKIDEYERSYNRELRKLSVQHHYDLDGHFSKTPDCPDYMDKLN